MIRPAAAPDAAAIAEIWNPVIRDTAVTFNAVEKTPEGLVADFAAKALAGHGFLVAEAGGRVLGFANYSQFRGGVGYARSMEHTIILAPQAQRQGVGRALMAAIEDHARAGGAHALFAGVSAENPAGVEFHRRIGFNEVARLREVGFKFGRWLDLILLQKFL
ncbi:MAG TPA: GNAT family N-acetyltransferase [Paracoccaceae bacterium]|nr:GNAT family N-acetyltransferase [Paracoccaceae bacterium]